MNSASTPDIDAPAPDGSCRRGPGRPPCSTLGRRSVLGLLASVLSGAFVVACAPQIDNRGNMVDIENLVEVIPGESDKARVEALLGSPSSTANFGEDIWYYVGRKTQRRALFRSEVLEQRVVFISFARDGFVDAVGELDQADGKQVEYVNRETPTAGQRITLLQQLIGNIGRFNPEQ
jgi:outer membrane protein assembly factor BamE (lipoprotein component of BamABCDE complex)